MCIYVWVCVCACVYCKKYTMLEALCIALIVISYVQTAEQPTITVVALLLPPPLPRKEILTPLSENIQAVCIT